VQAERAEERPEGAAGGRDGVFRRVQTADRRGEHGGAAYRIGASAHQLPPGQDPRQRGSTDLQRAVLQKQKHPELIERRAAEQQTQAACTGEDTQPVSQTRFNKVLVALAVMYRKEEDPDGSLLQDGSTLRIRGLRRLRVPRECGAMLCQRLQAVWSSGQTDASTAATSSVCTSIGK
jgi:hypothetical protein